MPHAASRSCRASEPAGRIDVSVSSPKAASIRQTSRDTRSRTISERGSISNQPLDPSKVNFNPAFAGSSRSVRNISQVTPLRAVRPAVAPRPRAAADRAANVSPVAAPDGSPAVRSERAASESPESDGPASERSPASEKSSSRTEGESP